MGTPEKEVMRLGDDQQCAVPVVRDGGRPQDVIAAQRSEIERLRAELSRERGLHRRRSGSADPAPAGRVSASSTLVSNRGNGGSPPEKPHRRQPFRDSERAPAVAPHLQPFRDSERLPAVSPHRQPFRDSERFPAESPHRQPFRDSERAPAEPARREPGFGGGRMAESRTVTPTRRAPPAVKSSLSWHRPGTGKAPRDKFGTNPPSFGGGGWAEQHREEKRDPGAEDAEPGLNLSALRAAAQRGATRQMAEGSRHAAAAAAGGAGYSPPGGGPARSKPGHGYHPLGGGGRRHSASVRSRSTGDADPSGGRSEHDGYNSSYTRRPSPEAGRHPTRQPRERSSSWQPASPERRPGASNFGREPDVRRREAPVYQATASPGPAKSDGLDSDADARVQSVSLRSDGETMFSSRAAGQADRKKAAACKLALKRLASDLSFTRLQISSKDETIAAVTEALRARQEDNAALSAKLAAALQPRSPPSAEPAAGDVWEGGEKAVVLAKIDAASQGLAAMQAALRDRRAHLADTRRAPEPRREVKGRLDFDDSTHDEVGSFKAEADGDEPRREEGEGEYDSKLDTERQVMLQRLQDSKNQLLEDFADMRWKLRARISVLEKSGESKQRRIEELHAQNAELEKRVASVSDNRKKLEHQYRMRCETTHQQLTRARGLEAKGKTELDRKLGECENLKQSLHTMLSSKSPSIPGTFGTSPTPYRHTASSRPHAR
ncbi:hypothetical protein DIPPA_27250 [Diplonema papillatum]|nr:hypothetical protein DIPPA_27250 [Diplonema papillatum]